MLCWYCNKETGIADTDYGDHQCRECGILISVYNPAEFVPMEEVNSIDDFFNPTKEEEVKPQKRTVEYEKLAIGEFIIGVIDSIEYEQEHKFKGFQGKEDTVQPAVRFKFAFEGYKFPHYSRWLKFSYGEKANLYKIFLTKLVEGAKPDMDFDLDLVKGMKVKTLWNENGDFQNLESIFPLGAKARPGDVVPTEEVIEEEPQPLD